MGPFVALMAVCGLATPPAGRLAFQAGDPSDAGRLVVRSIVPGGSPDEGASHPIAGAVGEMTFAPDGRYLAYSVGPGHADAVDLADAGYQVWMLDLADGRAKAATKDASWYGLSWSPDGRTLAAVSAQGASESWLNRITPNGTVSRLRRIEGEVPRRTAILSDGRVIYRSDKGRWVAANRSDQSEILLTDSQLGMSDWRISADGKTVLDIDAFVLRTLGATSGVVWELPQGFRFDLGRNGQNLLLSTNGSHYLAWARDLTLRNTIIASGPFAKRAAASRTLEGRWEPIGISNDGEWAIAKPGSVADGTSIVALNLVSGKTEPYLSGVGSVGVATWIETVP